ncbi:unnamed protein product [Adineta steineri]|uniref:G-protein coupled receptors family 1 profile domain-containing protein n=1 Tax=Adineta steineri TaxID=433720 RepID=A0A819RDL3_9BILA|nr:unnamed protein product [Adineta steineri]
MSASSTNTTSTNVDAINTLKYSRILFIQVWCFTMFSFGTVGHILSIYVFTRRSLYSNPCAKYFLASAVVGLIVVYTFVPLRLLQVVYKIDAFASSDAMCRILSWLSNWIKALPSWFIVLACADRFVCSSSSATTRAWSSIRVVTRATLLTILVVGLADVHIAFYNRLSTASSCAIVPGTYTTFYGIFNLFIFGLGPPVCMFTFGLLAIRNVRQSVRRIIPNHTPTGTQNQVQHRQKATDRQLMQMMIVQSMFFILTGTPNSFYFFCSSAVSNVVLDALQTVRLSLIASVTTFLTNGGACMSFYVFTLSSQLFRRELIRLFNYHRQIMQVIITVTRNNQIQPI